MWNKFISVQEKKLMIMEQFHSIFSFNNELPAAREPSSPRPHHRVFPPAGHHAPEINSLRRAAGETKGPTVGAERWGQIPGTTSAEGAGAPGKDGGQWRCG